MASSGPGSAAECHGTRRERHTQTNPREQPFRTHWCHHRSASFPSVLSPEPQRRHSHDSRTGKQYTFRRCSASARRDRRRAAWPRPAPGDPLSGRPTPGGALCSRRTGSPSAAPDLRTPQRDAGEGHDGVGAPRSLRTGHDVGRGRRWVQTAPSPCVRRQEDVLRAAAGSPGPSSPVPSRPRGPADSTRHGGALRGVRDVDLQIVRQGLAREHLRRLPWPAH